MGIGLLWMQGLAAWILAGAGPLCAEEIFWTSFGGARTVSGSMHLVEWKDVRILLDCGTFFSDEAAVQRISGADPSKLNTSLPEALGKPDLVVLSHAHLDHSGRLPLLSRSGWRGPIYATTATVELCRHMLSLPLRYGPLPEEVLFRSRKSAVLHSAEDCTRLSAREPVERLRTSRQQAIGLSRHMCTACVERDLAALMQQFVPVQYGTWQDLRPGLRLRLSNAGHIVGAAIAELEFDGKRRLVFSGDLGGRVPLIVSPPESPERADTVAVESTYGASVRSVPQPPYSDFEEALVAAARKGEPVVIVAYTLDRTQRVLHLIRRAQRSGRLPSDWPVTMPSPSAAAATEAYERLLAGFGEKFFSRSLVEFARSAGRPFRPDRLLLRDRGSSRGAFIVPAALEFSKTGQRILARLVQVPRAHVFLVGYANPESIGGQLLAGRSPRLDGTPVPLRAEVRRFSVFSGHADSEEVVAWLKGIQSLRRVLVVHGEPEDSEALAEKIRERLKVLVLSPMPGQRISLRD
jgi:metallo-beta-lactamase family protein